MNPGSTFKKLCKLFSLIFSTFTVLYLLYIVVLVKIALPDGTFTFPLLRSAATEESTCSRNVTRDTIVRVKNSKTYLIAAYLDLRSSRSIRILGITNRYEPDVLLCDFCIPGANNTAVVELQVHSDHFDFPYGTTDLLCNLQDERVPEFVSVKHVDGSAPTYLRIHNIEQQGDVPLGFQYQFLICVSAMFGSYSNVLQFIQSMEMYKLLGAQKVVIYHTDSSPVMKKVLSYYTQEKFLDLIPWPITSYLNVSMGWHFPDHPGDLHYFGQTAALNDCMYRHMYKSRFIALNDIDELILPVRHKDWPEMLDYIRSIDQNSDIFIFENHVFPTTLEDKSSPVTPKDWASVPGLNILQHIYREPNQLDEINPTKMIVNPRTVVKASVHVPLDFTGEQYQVPSDIAKLCHYREPKQKDLQRESLIADTILSKYEATLVKRVNRVLYSIESDNIILAQRRKNRNQ